MAEQSVRNYRNGMSTDDTHATCTNIDETSARAEAFLDSSLRLSTGECRLGDSERCQIARETLVSLGAPRMGSWNPVARLSSVLVQNTL